MSNNIDYIPHKTKMCSICDEPLDVMVNADTGEVLWDKGNNAEPVNDGRCCQACNSSVVITTRLQLMLARKRSEVARADAEGLVKLSKELIKEGK